MNSAPFPEDVDLAVLNMLEARKALDEYELSHGFDESVEYRKLEKEFSEAAERYRRVSSEKQ